MNQNTQVNADSSLNVEFYSRKVKNEFKSKQESFPVFDDVDFVKICLAGDNLSIVDTLVNDSHKQRFQSQWGHYIKNNGNGEEFQNGTPIEEWPLVSNEKLEVLKYLKFKTVESIANASDSQLQNLQMVVGMSPYSFRDKAITFLKLLKNQYSDQQADLKIKELKEENEKIKKETEDKLSKMQQQMELLMKMLPSQDDGALHETTDKRRGRPPKNVEMTAE